MDLAFHDPVAPTPAISRALQHALTSWDGLFDWLPIGVYTCDLQGYVVQYNERAAELWGRSPAIPSEQTRFCGAHRLFRPDREPLPFAETPMAELLTTGRPVRDREVMLERPDGTRLTSSPISTRYSTRTALLSAA